MATTLVPAGLLVYLNGPLPQRRPFDLLSEAQFPEHSQWGEHWQAGVQVYPYPTDLPGVHAPCAGGGSYGTKADGDAPPLPQFGGFTAYLPITCTARGMGQWDAYMRRAEIAFEAKVSYAVELELMFDAAGVGNPHLASGDADNLSAAAVKASEGLALLENAIAGDTAVVGLIHADPATVTAWSREFLVFHEGGRLRTTNGTPVVAGAGYVGAHPSNKPVPGATQAWAFATGPVQVLQTGIYGIPEVVEEAVDREFNVVTFLAEENIVVDWDTAFLAEVLIDRSL